MTDKLKATVHRFADRCAAPLGKTKADVLKRLRVAIERNEPELLDELGLCVKRPVHVYIELSLSQAQVHEALIGASRSPLADNSRYSKEVH